MTFRRRTFLGGLAATAALHSTGLLAHGRKPRIGVIGGGIIGASIAAQLAHSGADVIVFEKEAPASGATRNSVAWINPVVNDAHYMKLRLESMKAWLEDDRQWGMRAIWGGSTSWAYENKRASLQEKATLLQATDDPPRYLTGPEITKVTPGVVPGDNVKLAFQTFKDGHVDPVFATQRYLAAAKRHGAKIVYPCQVTAVTMREGRVVGVKTTKGDFALDQLVSATGTDTPQIMALVGRELKLAHKPGLVVHTTPRSVITKQVFEASSIIEFKQYADGRFLTSFTSGPPDLPQHAEILQRQMDYPSDFLKQHHGEMLIARTAEYMPAIAEAKPTKILLGFRPYPLDNRPIIGPVPGAGGVYVVVTHSGITLAPILGRYAAQEIMTGSQTPILAPYRPTRYIKA
ncbi:FAD-binding oxidoreductase [Sphingobium sp. LMA1-1-1.1]|uniref:NAD(P)/FAD-dependent oxidoreductase n=1 Tax=unclassified Sphingobium TaxID=2611147 RepID=UPI00341E6E56